MKADKALRFHAKKHSRFVTAFLAILAATGPGLIFAEVAEAAGGHNLVLTRVPTVAKFRDPETVTHGRVLDVKSVNVLTSNGHTACFKAVGGRDVNTGLQVRAGVKVQAYLHAAAGCSDGASFDSPFTTVVPNNVKTANYRFKLRD